MVEKIRSGAAARMQKSLEKFRGDLRGVRTGKAAPSILESVRVDYYDSVVPLAQIASISAPQPRLLVIQPWDKGAAEAIVKGIQNADLGLNPAQDGELIRVPIPALTEERRHELVRQCKRMSEEVKVSIRNIRRDANDELTKAEKAKEISEDDLHRGQKDVQKTTDEHIAEVDSALAEKEKEILEG
ncbi:MAG: ribosome recycling factor [Candidatus Eisenbacteria bacterium]|nr:ribosome recycling factor [Candidatus Eisenbacteria bacterium]